MAETIAFSRRAFTTGAAYLRSDLRIVLPALFLVAALSFAVDVGLPASVGGVVNLVVACLTLYLQILLTFRMLYANGAAPPGYTLAAKTEARFPSMFAAGFMAGVAILLGLLLLVLPGLVLMVLWSLTLPTLAAERLGATNAMRRSWQLARPALGRLALIGTAFVGAVALIFLATVAAVLLLPGGGWLPKLIIDLGFSALTLGSAPVWTAAYLELRGSDTSAA